MNLNKERPEEIRARETILNKYSDFLSYQYEPNGNATAPDYLLKYKAGNVVLEVTLSNDFYIDQKGDVQSKHIVNDAKELEKSLMPLIEKNLSVNESIIIFTSIPRKRIKSLYETLIESINFENLKLESKQEFEIRGKTVSVSVTTYYNGNPKIFVGDTSNLDSKHLVAESSLLAQAQFVLISSLDKKFNKLQNLSSDQKKLKKWLAIFNTNFLLSIDIYKQALNSIKHKEEIEFFDKIFIIENLSALEIK